MHDYDRKQLEDGLEGNDTQDDDLGEGERTPRPLKGTGEDLLNIYVPPYKDHSDVKLYSVIEVQACICLTYRGTLKFIRDNITPIGGTVRVGNRLFVHVWALNYALEQRVWTTKKMRQRYQFTDRDRRRARG
jgi:hypothetical protein